MKERGMRKQRGKNVDIMKWQKKRAEIRIFLIASPVSIMNEAGRVGAADCDKRGMLISLLCFLSRLGVAVVIRGRW